MLPLKTGDLEIPADENGVGGIGLGGLERRMRERWQAVSRLWERNRAPVNEMNLLQQLDYMGKLSYQLEWQSHSDHGQVRLVYTKSGEPTAALVRENETLVDHLLYWISCKTEQEANYLLAIINSNALFVAAEPLMNKGQFGARDLHKHLWKLPIPEYDPAVALHAEIAGAGAEAAQGAAQRRADLRAEWQRKHEDWESKGKRGREPLLTVTIIRRELRAWLRTSPQGAAAEQAVGRLLAGGG